ncbi:MAG: hypothetical protein AMJ94_09555 [Deltaproteobacteria bacterium SM23_61]|nr:MAG: hypothetical protein AMJ94_09555 [Deltaproteobacteria bacterium SM23_61]
MKWLEVIKLRSAGGSLGLLEELLLPLSESDPRGLVEMKTYRHAVLETDLSVHLHWNSEMPEPNGSALGLRLAQALKEFGLVDHSVWVDNKK